MRDGIYVHSLSDKKSARIDRGIIISLKSDEIPVNVARVSL